MAKTSFVAVVANPLTTAKSPMVKKPKIRKLDEPVYNTYRLDSVEKAIDLLYEDRAKTTAILMMSAAYITIGYVQDQQAACGWHSWITFRALLHQHGYGFYASDPDGGGGRAPVVLPITITIKVELINGHGGLEWTYAHDQTVPCPDRAAFPINSSQNVDKNIYFNVAGFGNVWVELSSYPPYAKRCG